jgi:hypothetical protein
MIRKNRLLLLLLTLVLALSVISFGCGNKDDDDSGDDSGKTTKDGGKGGDSDDKPANLPKYTSKGNEGTINGKVSFDGAAPAARKIQMDADDVCAKKNPNAVADDVVVNDGKLENVLVYVKDGPSTKFSYDVPTEQVPLDQNGCQYRPHIIGVRAKEDLKITTSDATTHNIHPQPKNNKEWNESQPANGAPLIKSFARAEIIPVKCNQHPWMKAYIGVFDSPFYAVTGKDGSYEIKGLPPGEYTIEFWHEKLGTQTQKVKVGEKETKSVDMSFKAASAMRSPEENGVKLGTTLVLPMLNGR